MQQTGKRQNNAKSMNRAKHRETVSERIISEARKLFLTKGYAKTKMRQIGEAADVKTGTIYHFYENKEDIFARIVHEAFFRVIERTRSLAGEDPLLHLATELAWHTHTMAQHAPSAELYMIAYNSPRIADELLRKQIVRSEELFGTSAIERSAIDYKVYAMLARGLMQAVSLQAVAKQLTDVEETIQRSLSYLLKIMETPPEVTDGVLVRLAQLNIAERVRNILED